MWASAVASRCRHGLANLSRPASRQKPPTQQKTAGSHVGHTHLKMKPGQNIKQMTQIFPLLLGFVVFGPDVLAKSVSSGTSVSTGQEVRPHVVKRSTRDCDSTFEHYCMNNGQCMLLVDINEHHCKCEAGFYGPRCGNLEFVIQPVTEEQIVAAVFCVSLLLIGLAGALFFFYKWYKKNRLTKKTGLCRLH